MKRRREYELTREAVTASTENNTSLAPDTVTVLNLEEKADAQQSRRLLRIVKTTPPGASVSSERKRQPDVPETDRNVKKVKPDTPNENVNDNDSSTKTNDSNIKNNDIIIKTNDANIQNNDANIKNNDVIINEEHEVVANASFIDAFASIAKTQTPVEGDLGGFLSSGVKSFGLSSLSESPSLSFASSGYIAGDASLTPTFGSVRESNNNNNNEDEHNGSDDEDVCTRRPGMFPGEEQENEAFVASNVVLFKLITTDVDKAKTKIATTTTSTTCASSASTTCASSASTTCASSASTTCASSASITCALSASTTCASSASTTCASTSSSGDNEGSGGEDAKPAKKSTSFKKQGEGIFKLLTPKVDSKSRGRLVMRQKGTWSVLLNSPVEATSRFDKFDQLSSGSGLKFSGLDGFNEDTRAPLFSVYCVKFRTSAERSEFLAAAQHPMIN
eukprot:CAMPEP_0113847186 /NCGR_PEP_ID=MMETSP0372-20130328/1731_1 /TAXON_ID=340204 /ORGANISM="Lankesteria abbotti" /LENGTH=447 /DNA_ID=CAMNT_0000816429 /DNA_START=137 /DNA_END=1480 /DNA_ORIENTATION=- /assembly_acc=CAM_ASM_000359